MIHAGYTVTRAIAPAAWCAIGVPRVVSASFCVAPQLPEMWCVEWASMSASERHALADAAGVPADRRDEAIALVTEAHGRGGTDLPALTRDRSLAEALRTLAGPGALLLSLAVREEDASLVLEPDRVEHAGIAAIVARAEAAPADVEPIGWEVVGDDYGSLHSWLCHGLPGALAAAGESLELTAEGLLVRREDAVRIARRCHDEELGVEPCPWLAVQVSRLRA